MKRMQYPQRILPGGLKQLYGHEHEMLFFVDGFTELLLDNKMNARVYVSDNDHEVCAS